MRLDGYLAETPTRFLQPALPTDSRQARLIESWREFVLGTPGAAAGPS